MSKEYEQSAARRARKVAQVTAARAAARALETPEDVARRRAITNAQYKALREADPERFAAYRRNHRARNLEEARARGRATGNAAYAADPEKFNARSRAAHAANRQQRNAAQSARYAANAEQRRAAQRAYYAADTEKQQAAARAARAANPEKFKARSATRYAANPAPAKAAVAKRRGLQLQATPTWSETALIAAFYAACPPGAEVDHWLPLQGRTVSGLHVLANLQYLTRDENRAKLNKMPHDTMPPFMAANWTRMMLARFSAADTEMAA
jgi:hypothetical protein